MLKCDHCKRQASDVRPTRDGVWCFCSGCRPVRADRLGTRSRRGLSSAWRRGKSRARYQKPLQQPDKRD